ncbi:EamA family transporter [Nonomuraea gerenzanensis]|uniref:Integral membrane protein n=1 Tax=Nonomuraea gerenzanensis TaxID=93944 RepID=A0A1M4ED88_9ACTN|nr:EamA family transporter [Nonomuraea gerenzanensis]UBU08307.1 EamA family transporter [Nonomuraea gerenzanensis]SBO96638.1 integral membrane protein [Nonomuraea gerenzanensis]
MRCAGLALAFGASWCFAFSGPMAKYLDAAGLTPIETVWARMAGAGLLLAVVLAVVRPRALRIPRGRVPFVGLYAVVAAYLWMVVVATVVAYILGVSAVRRLSAAVGVTVASLEVVGGAVVAWGLVGEELGAFQMVGGLIMLSGALLAQTATATGRLLDQDRAGV